MIKIIWTLLFLFSTAISFGQDIILQKNTHPKTKELKHNLNQTKDTLIMGCESSIFKVEIFNEDYEKIIIVENIQAHIPLNDLPAGRFVVQAQLSNKIVVMHLVKRDNMNDVHNSNLSTVEKELAETKTMGLSGDKNIKRNASHHSIEYLLSGRKPKRVSNKNQKFYWTLATVNTGDTSSRTMYLANQRTVDKMISKHKLEIKTSNARRNELIIWEVYDKSKFLEQQFANPDYINSSVSNFFDVSPYYTLENNFK
jgi:hypothetical protein